jgi:hypothetical protein
MATISPGLFQLREFNVAPGTSSVSGLSSGAFMTVQLHLAHSASFAGAGVIAGGPCRCAQSLGQTPDLQVQAALYVCMNPLTDQTAPDVDYLVRLTHEAERDGRIDPVENLADDKLYIFTGTEDQVVSSRVVARTKRFYRQLGVPEAAIEYCDEEPAGHAIITENLEDSQLELNQPPYINRGDFWQSHRILRHVYGSLKPPSAQLSGRLVRFDQRPYFGGSSRASMSEFGYAYIPKAVEQGAPARIHIALHGCKQGYNYVDYVNGRADTRNQPPYGNRYFTTTGYNEIADSNDIIVLYPQAEGADDGQTQNPEGCWDWWGYSTPPYEEPDYWSRDAIQIKAIHSMLQALGG